MKYSPGGGHIIKVRYSCGVTSTRLMALSVIAYPVRTSSLQHSGVIKLSMLQPNQTHPSVREVVKHFPKGCFGHYVRVRGVGGGSGQ